MPDYVNINQTKQQSQYLNMRGAQMAQEKAGRSSRPQTKGTKKQLIGTIVGIVVLIAALILLKVFGVI